MNNSLITIQNRPLQGVISAPPSKSLSHRALICADLAGGGKIENLGVSDDIEATKRCLCALRTGDILDAGESATTLRLLIPMAMACGGTFRCGGSLIRRSIEPFERIFPDAFTRGGDQLTVRGGLMPGRYHIDASVSSQFISGMLLALVLRNGDSELLFSQPPVSTPYIRLTLDMMAKHGVMVEEKPDRFLIPGRQTYKRAHIIIEGDWSYAAFFFAANALGGNVTAEGLNPNSLQGDRAILSALSLRSVDMRDIPDLLPALAAAACAVEGETCLYNAARLRGKESDRLFAMASGLAGLGADIMERADALIIRGGKRLHGGTVDSRGDHRIAMALACMGAFSNAPIRIQGANAVNKSAPHFFNDIRLLGGFMK